MRIGIDIKTLKNRMSGIQMYVTKLLDALQTIDNSNDYLLYEPKPSSYRLFNPRWKRVLLPSRLPGTLWLQTMVPPRLRSDRIDIFWGPEQVCPLWKPSGIRYATTIHDYTFRRFPKTVRGTTRLILNLTWKRVLEVSDLLLPVSELICEETRSHLGSDQAPLLTTVTNGAPDWQIPPEYHPDKRGNALLFIGSIEPRKNLTRLIEALELLHSRGIRPTLKIVSPATWHSDSLSKKLTTSPVRTQVKFCGYLSTTALQHELLTCKALVFPSLYEGFGIPVLEALSLDCLVLTSHQSAMEQIAGTCACYFDPYTPAAIAACIKEIFQPGFKRETILQNRATILSRYTWNASAHQLLTSFEQLVSRNQSFPK